MVSLIRCLALAAVLLAAGAARADLTPILAGVEPSLARILGLTYTNDAGAVTMSQVNSARFTVGAYTFTRIDDFAGQPAPSTSPRTATRVLTDALFQGGSAPVAVTERYATSNIGFGWSSQTGQVSALTYHQILSAGAAPGSAGMVSLDRNAQFAIRVDGALGPTFWGTNEKANGGFDHFVTWRVQGNGRLFSLIAAESLDLGDGGYNDWVGEITLIPLPPAAWAGLGGLALASGVATLRRRGLRQ